MRNTAMRAFLLAALICGARQSTARETATAPALPQDAARFSTTSDLSAAARSRAATAVLDTFLLAEFTFDDNGPDPEGWSGVDNSTDFDRFFHVAGVAELNGGSFGRLVPLEGNRSLWCGIPPGYATESCAYATLPGYGNSWQQAFTSVPLAVTGDVTISFLASYDSEPGEDLTSLRYLDSGGNWVQLLEEDFATRRLESATIPAANLGPTTQVSIVFRSDGAWSDEDGLFDSDGAVLIDSLVVADDTGVVDFQDFEAEADGARETSDGRWSARREPSRGDFTGLFSGLSVVQEDACRFNASFLWAFVNGSTDDYSCGGFPQQAAVPYPQAVASEFSVFGPVDVYVDNEVRSPVIDLTQDIHGNPVPANALDVVVELDLYSDFDPTGGPLSGVLFTLAHREYESGCGGAWERLSGNSSRKGWIRLVWPFPTSPSSQGLEIALGVADPFSGLNPGCHSHAPLYDNVRVMKVVSVGPHWDVSSVGLFQDAFAQDGTKTGTVRMDAAWGKPADPNLQVAGDSVFVTVEKPGIGLDFHVPGDTASGPAVYLHVRDVSVAKSGAVISGDPARFPVVATGGGWTVVQFDTVVPPIGFPVDPAAMCVDLNDALYTPGDTIYYYFSARDANGVTSYWSEAAGGATTLALAEMMPTEVTCLPANGLAGTSDILYIDGADGSGAQPYFDSAFQALGITPDRYDHRGAGINGLFASPGGRAVPAALLADCYRTIIWNTGDRSKGLFSNPAAMTSDDYALLHAFLDQGPDAPGLYLSGNGLAGPWLAAVDADADALRDDFMSFALVSGDHLAAGLPLSPLGIGSPGGCFDHPAGPDTLVAFGGCALAARFDVLQALGSAGIEMTYGGNPALAAVLAQATANSAGDTARVVFSGFSYDQIRDDRTVVPVDRYEHLRDILGWLRNGTGAPVAAGDQTPARTALAQNYPNPFNPTTTITYSLATRGSVELAVYNVRGQRVRTLVAGERAPGIAHTVVWDGTNDAGQAVSSGVYFYRFTSKEFTKTRKMVLLK